MYVKCWGARGSSPVSGKKFIKYGGNTSCVEVRAGDPEVVLLLDLGTGALPMGRNFLREDRKNLDVLVTHYHWDHIMGFPLFPPMYARGNKLRFHFNPQYQGNPAKLVVKDMMNPPHFPIDTKDMPASIIYSEVESEFFAGQIKIKSIPLCHPDSGLGYRLEYNNKSMVFLTDNELGFQHRGGLSIEDYAKFCMGADLLIHDAEFYNPQEYQQVKGFGHSLVDYVLDLARTSEVKSLGLFHHHRERTDDQIDSLVNKLNHDTPEKYPFEIFAVAQEQEMHL